MILLNILKHFRVKRMYFFQSKIESYMTYINEIKATQTEYIHNMEKPAGTLSQITDPKDKERPLFELLRDGDLQFTISDTVLNRFRKNFHGYDEIINSFNEIVEFRQSRKLIIATHMHAGDGNIHVNIPVHSNDYRMMLDADEIAGIVMKETTEKFNGVISGEHGIGLTKLKFIDKEAS